LKSRSPSGLRLFLVPRSDPRSSRSWPAHLVWRIQGPLGTGADSHTRTQRPKWGTTMIAATGQTTMLPARPASANLGQMGPEAQAQVGASTILMERNRTHAGSIDGRRHEDGRRVSPEEQQRPGLCDLPDPDPAASQRGRPLRA